MFAVKVTVPCPTFVRDVVAFVVELKVAMLELEILQEENVCPTGKLVTVYEVEPEHNLKLPDIIAVVDGGIRVTVLEHIFE